MLIAKGYRVAFKMKANKKVLKAPSSYAFLHDPTGRDWPKTSVLVAGFSKGSSELSNAEAEKYFGYVPQRGAIDTPPRSLSQWKDLGEVAEIDYWRPGEHEASYYHPFKAGGWLFSRGELPRLYKRGRQWRLELGPGAILNWRGFVYP